MGHGPIGVLDREVAVLLLPLLHLFRFRLSRRERDLLSIRRPAEAADGGTVFLDEVGDISLELQTKLLRFLQEREFERVGGTQPIRVDIRIIAATNKNLEEAIQRGFFREDLYHRLNVIAITVPALRDRQEDIAPLAEFFLRRFAIETKKVFSGFTAEALDQLRRYFWPGNVRELENVIERALVLSGGEIGEEHLPVHVRTSHPVFQIPVDGDDLSVKRRLPALERELIAKALERTRGNRTRAAEILDLSTRALTYKIQEYGLS